MLASRTWLIGAVVLWVLSLVIGLAGYALDSDALLAVSLPLRRAALAVTILWAALAAAAALRRRVIGR